MLTLYDTTLRDGAQGEGISFTLEDKLRIARKLDEFGMHYIEGGWPGSNPKDIRFFRRIKELDLTQAKIVAFGSTRRAKFSVEKDPNIVALLQAETPVVTIFGKSWDLHIRAALGVSLEQNLEMIYDSVAFLKRHVPEVIFDAEHFFDGYQRNPRYALQTLLSAQEAGADLVVLCDTNGGMLPSQIASIIAAVKDSLSIPWGIHTHNDSELAVANALAAVELGASQVQGTINGYGERCGNANLCSIVPCLKLKMKRDCVSDDQLRRLKELSRFVSELANLPHWTHQPFVGESAFAHKGGIHVSAVQKDSDTYEHIQPEWVGSKRRFLISELSGRGTILAKAEELSLPEGKDHDAVERVLDRVKEMEEEGYQFEGAEASFELLMRKALGQYWRFFDLEGFRVIVEKRGNHPPSCEATIKVVVKGVAEHTAAEGVGPVNALDNALRKALEEFYPGLKEISLLDYKVRILDEHEGTASKTRVLIQSGDGEREWGTVGVSPNIIEASWEALVDSLEYKLLKDHKSES
ncbi:MAG: citramalate synthase [candidate division NC10 bacterium]|nr:citramalate synthase [candidate division NC10 bacterium]